MCMNKRKKLLTKKKLARHLFSLTLAVILMGGCITPAYYSHEQEIELTVPRGATAELDGKPLEKKGDKVRTTVERSWRDKEIIVKKEGYQDATVKLDSVPTDDKWGRTLWGGEDSGAVMWVPPLVFLWLPSDIQ